MIVPGSVLHDVHDRLVESPVTVGLWVLLLGILVMRSVVTLLAADRCSVGPIIIGIGFLHSTAVRGDAGPGILFVSHPWNMFPGAIGSIRSSTEWYSPADGPVGRSDHCGLRDGFTAFPAESAGGKPVVTRHLICGGVYLVFSRGLSSIYYAVIGGSSS